jgi:hypothetical protein
VEELHEKLVAETDPAKRRALYNQLREKQRAA